ncbi:serine hydrolase domain-containing protein [Paraglaciecola sp.]|uniref:serine hydrolase domain-containing protein n=1 Tax=Paraglaciecola sp. TaxID=1920173 RepID=UPI003296AEDA
MRRFVDRLVADTLKQWQQPAISMSLLWNNDTYSACSGVRRKDQDATINEQTHFALASCSKAFIVNAILILQSKGKLDLDDLVKDYIHGLTFSNEVVASRATIRDLMCNRLGLISSEGRHRQVAFSRKDLITRMAFQPFQHEFKGSYAYCTDGFTLLGEIVTRVLDAELGECLEQLLFTPLGMNHTNVSHVQAKSDGNFASPHLWLDGSLAPIDWNYEDHVAAPAGGVNSNAEDLQKWLYFILSGQSMSGKVVLPEEFLALSSVPHMKDEGQFAEHELSQAMGIYAHLVQEEAYALGWYTHIYKGSRVYYHTGSIDGFRSLVGYVKDCNFAVSIMVNGDNPFLPRMLFQTLVDKVKGVNVANWSSLFAKHQTDMGNNKVLQPFPKSDLDIHELDLLRPFYGNYCDSTGFGMATIRQHDLSVIMTVGALQFYLHPIGELCFEAYKIWPYCVGPQFSANGMININGELVGFTTTQQAIFTRLIEPQNTWKTTNNLVSK